MVIKIESDNVFDALDNLEEAVENYEEALMVSIADLAKTRETEKMREKIDQADLIKKYLETINDLRSQWNQIISNEKNVQSINHDTKDVTERTSWEIIDGNFRIETVRPDGSSPYSNIIPLKLFKEIAQTTLKIVSQNGSIKTSDVASILTNRIITESDYKKTPKLPVYATFKVLVKEAKLKIDEKNSHKYLLATSKSEFSSWINNLK